MSDSEELKSARQYETLFKEHGDSYKTLNWGSESSQILRFRIISQIANLHGRRILDVGCGLGHFATWLKETGVSVDYSGLDLTEALVNQARVRHPDNQFHVGSILDTRLLQNQHFDYVFASGIFYTYQAGGEEWMKKAISRMWSLCTKGIAFNSLSTWCAAQDPAEFYANPADTINFCRSLSPWISLRHDYHPRDFTVYVNRSASL